MLGLLFLYLCLHVGCEQGEDGGRLSQLVLHPDTVRFDSVFTGSISSTQILSVRNPGSRSVHFDRVALQGDDGQYALLVDGVAGSTIRNYALRSGDSLLVAVRLRPNRSGGREATAVNNSIRLQGGGEERSVPLLAKSLPSIPLRMDTLRDDLHLAGAPARLVERTMYIPKGVTLRISGDAALYFRAGAGLVVDGSLQVEGAKRQPVVFAGDRLETYYRRKPGQWSGINLRAGSGPHALRWAVIRGAVCGVRADSLEQSHPLVVEHCHFLFNSLEGIDAGHTSVVIRSTLFAQNYRHAIRLRGAHASITHSTLYGVSAPPQIRQGSLLGVQRDGTGELPSFTVQNSILWGDRESEIEPALKAEYATRFILQHSLAKVRAKDTARLPTWRYITIDNPKFESPAQQQFALRAESPARARAWRAVSLVDSVALNGANRTKRPGNADLGAYEYAARD